MGCSPSKSLSSKSTDNILNAVGSNPPAESPIDVEISKGTQSFAIGDIQIRYAFLAKRGFYPDGISS